MNIRIKHTLLKRNKKYNYNMLTQEMFNCFEWYLNKYLEIYKGSGNNEKDSTL